MYNNMNDDEKYLFKMFFDLMQQVGCENLFALEKDINNGYSIYKEDNRWILFREEMGLADTYNQYTNLYNLCLDVIKNLDDRKKDFCMRIFLANNVIPKGTEVLVFNRIKGCKLDTRNFVKGRVIGKRESEDLSMHGSPWSSRLYIVQGEDNEYYIGKYGNAMEGYFFKTIEDYINHIFNVIEDNNHQIKELKNENKEYRKLLSDIIVKHNEKLMDKGK